MAAERPDEAQALLHTYVEHGHVRNGTTVAVERTAIPDEYYEAVESAVIEQLFLARADLSDYHRLAANVLTERLVRDGVIYKGDAARVCNQIEAEIKRSLDRLTETARSRFVGWLPLNLRSLIPTAVKKRSTTK